MVRTRRMYQQQQQVNIYNAHQLLECQGCNTIMASQVRNYIGATMNNVVMKISRKSKKVDNIP